MVKVVLAVLLSVPATVGAPEEGALAVDLPVSRSLHRNPGPNSRPSDRIVMPREKAALANKAANPCNSANGQ